jgi:hypothetical protein
MAFGFPAHFSESRTYRHRQHELALVIRSAFDNLGWRYTDLPDYVFSAHIPMSAGSWGERVRIEICPDGLVKAESKCVYPLQCFDWGRNKQNIHAFFSQFKQTAKIELAD